MKPGQCVKCGCQDLEYKSGVSKKNGKPWAGWKCTNKNCGEMTFENTKSAPMKSPVGIGQTSDVVELLQDILQELQIMNGSKFEPKVQKSETPF